MPTPALHSSLFPKVVKTLDKEQVDGLIEHAKRYVKFKDEYHLGLE